MHITYYVKYNFAYYLRSKGGFNDTNEVAVIDLTKYFLNTRIYWIHVLYCIYR